MLLPDKVKEIDEKMSLPNRPEAWQHVYDKVYSMYKDSLIGDVMKARYILGQKVTFTCNDLGIGQDLYFKYRTKIINAFTAGLIQEGVLKFYD